MVTARWGLVFTTALAVGASAPAYADGQHRPQLPRGCTAVGPAAGCSFTASAYPTQVTVVDDPQWSLFVTRHGHLRPVEVDTSSCFGHTDFSTSAYLCFVSLPAGTRIHLVVHSAGIVRAGDDVCAVDPLCMTANVAGTQRDARDDR